MAELHAFKLPSGVTWCGNTHFNPDVGLENYGDVQFVPKFEIEEKSNIWLRRYGLPPIDDKQYLLPVEYLSSEVGDDEETVSNSSLFLAFQLVFTERTGTRISLPDTAINPRFGNFAEDLIVLPDGYDQTYLNARNTGSTKSMCYVDIPKLRLATDIRPMRMDHSSTNDGKASMIGTRMRWIPLDSPFRSTFEVFNLFQDINLGMIRDKKFPYLPQSLGGYGKETPFRNDLNFIRFVGSYKNGAHEFLIRNIVNRTVDYLSDLSEFRNPPKDPLLSHIVRFQASFHDWIKAKSIYAPVCWFDAPEMVAKFRAGKFGESVVIDEVMGRLLSERKLISEQQLQIAQEHNELCRALVEANDIPTFRRLREEARTSFKNLSIFSQESYGYIKEISLNQDTRNSVPLRTIDVQLFFKLVYAHRYNLRHIIGEEYVYYPEAMDAIYEQGPMKVKFNMYPLNKVGGMGFATSTSEFKSDIECTETVHALQDLDTWLRGDRQLAPPTIIINDDNVIINECAKHPYNVIVTDDIKLCREANRKTRNVVFRVPTLWYFKVVYFGLGSYTDYLSTTFPGCRFEEHMDMGSIQSFEEKFFHDGVMLKRPRYQEFNAWKPLGTKDQVITEEFEDYSEDPPVEPRSLLFDFTNILRSSRPYRGVREGRGTGPKSWR